MWLHTDKIINPETGHLISKYDAVWWKLIRTGWPETILEKIPLQSQQNVIITTLDNYPMSAKPQRAGVILYTYINDELFFGLGLDHTYHQFTDFAGGVKKNDNGITAALREFCEETIGLFCNINMQDLENSVILYDKYHLIIFYYTNLHPYDINEQFFQLKKTHKGKLEIDDIVWLSEDDLMYAIENKSDDIYIRLLNFLIKANHFTEYL